MDHNEIRVADAAGVLIRLRYIGTTHEVEVLDAEGRPKLKSVLREPVRFDGRQLVVNRRITEVDVEGSTVDEVAQWRDHTTVKPVEPASEQSATPPRRARAKRQRRTHDDQS